LKEIFSGVPQGAKWSPKLWDFDISELPDALSSWALTLLVSYADDCALWHEITAGNRSSIISIVNKDLESLVRWGEDNRTEFEPTKTKMMVVSRKRVPFDPTGIVMLGFPIEIVDEVKLVGYTIDPKLTWGPMIAALAKKGRMRVGALYRMSSMLDAENMKTMYIAFIRSVLECGSVQYMGAAQSHLDKLDRIQHTADISTRFPNTRSALEVLS
jgi:hypothetical protein